MNTFVLTPAAEDDFAQITAHLEGERPSSVVRVLGALEEAMQLLADNPGIGHVRADLTPLPVRFWPVFSYLVIYRSETKPLQIVRVLHGKRDVERILEE